MASWPAPTLLSTPPRRVLVLPVVATPQRVTTSSLQPVGITLSGVEASGLPLSFTVTAPPLGGALAGSPPQLTYTPAAEAAS